MLALAAASATAARATAADWTNVVLLGDYAETADLPEVDHALFCAVHDILQSGPALDHVVAHVGPGGWVCAVGGKWGPPFAVAANAAVLALHAPYVRDFAGFDRPWADLQERVPELVVDEVAMGCGFVARGRRPPR